MALRVILDGYRTPAENMAIDEAILQNRWRVSYDTLRIYRWRPSGVSLGRSQPFEAVDWEESQRLGFQVVRRPTGGGALLHWEEGEVTYSVVLSEDHSLYSMTVDESAMVIAGGVKEALLQMGVAGVTLAGESDRSRAEACYLRRGSSDVLIGGRKVSGSAQVRSGGILQHGTLLLDFNPELWGRVIRNTDTSELSRRVTSLREVDVRVQPPMVEKYLVRGFTSVLGTTYFYGDLTPGEKVLFPRLLEKYSSDEWNLERRLELTSV